MKAETFIISILIVIDITWLVLIYLNNRMPQVDNPIVAKEKCIDDNGLPIMNEQKVMIECRKYSIISPNYPIITTASRSAFHK